jgi:hypothetical protein
VSTLFYRCRVPHTRRAIRPYVIPGNFVERSSRGRRLDVWIYRRAEHETVRTRSRECKLLASALKPRCNKSRRRRHDDCRLSAGDKVSKSRTGVKESVFGIRGSGAADEDIRKSRGAQRGKFPLLAPHPARILRVTRFMHVRRGSNEHSTRSQRELSFSSLRNRFSSHILTPH